MSGSGDWVVTWSPFEVRTSALGTRILPRSREQKAFDSQREAVYFVMSLSEAERSTAELHLSGGQVAYLASIELMFSQYQKEE